MEPLKGLLGGLRTSIWEEGKAMDWLVFFLSRLRALSLQQPKNCNSELGLECEDLDMLVPLLMRPER